MDEYESSHESSIDEVLEQAVWAVEDQRLKPLADFLDTIPGVDVEGASYQGSNARNMARYLNVPPDELEVETDRWQVCFMLTPDETGWQTLGILAWVFNDHRILHKYIGDGKLTLRPLAFCACHNDPVESLGFVIDSTADPGAVAAGVTEVVSQFMAKDKAGKGAC
jgi:hypothetical protein